MNNELAQPRISPIFFQNWICLRAQRAKIRRSYPWVNFCAMVTPPNANIFGTLPYVFVTAGAARRARRGERDAAAAAGVPFTTNHLGSMFGGFFTEDETVTQYHQVINSNVEAFNQFFHLMLDSGVYLAPASFEAGFMSSAHTDDDIATTVAAASAAFSAL